MANNPRAKLVPSQTPLQRGKGDLGIRLELNMLRCVFVEHFSHTITHTAKWTYRASFSSRVASGTSRSRVSLNITRVKNTNDVHNCIRKSCIYLHIHNELQIKTTVTIYIYATTR